MEQLSTVLRRLREKAGYASSRKFFNDHDGRKFFGCTYRQYLNVEAGASIPSSTLMTKIAIALGLAHKPEARQVMTSYLGALGVTDDLLKLVESALGSAPAHPEGLVPSLARASQQRGVDLTVEQSKFLCAAYENYWAFTVLANDEAAWEPAVLAETIGAKKPAVVRALAGLLKHGLAEKDGDAYRCPHVGKIFRHPNSKVYTAGFDALRRYKDELCERKGEALFRYHLCTRGSEAQLRQYFPYLVQAVQGAGVTSLQHKGPDTVFFEVETIVRRLMPF